MKISIKIALINLLQLIAFNVVAQVKVKSADCSTTADAIELNNLINKGREVNNTVNLDDASRNLELCESCAYLAVYGCQCQSSDYDGDRVALANAIKETVHQIKVWDVQHHKTVPDACIRVIAAYAPDYNANPCATFKAKAGANGTGGKTEEKPKGPSDAAKFNNDLLNMANALVPFMEDAAAKKTVKDMNNVHKGFTTFKSLYNENDVDEKTTEFFDKAETVAQGIAIISNLLKKEEKVMTEGQIKSLQYAGILNEQVVNVYKNISTLPKQSKYDKMGLDAITEFENKVNEYDQATAMQRLILLKFMDQKEVPEITVIQSWVKQVQVDYSNKGVDFLKNQINELANRANLNNTAFSYLKSDVNGNIDANASMAGFYSSNTAAKERLGYLQNSNQSLKNLKTEILLFKSQYYYQIGDEIMALKVLDVIAESADYESVKQVINMAFDARNYNVAAQFYPILFAQWYKTVQTTNNKIVYKSYMNDINVIAKGIVSLAKNNQQTNAAAHLEQVSIIYDSFLNKPKEKKPKWAYENPFGNQQTEKVYFWHTKAEVLQKLGSYDEALKMIDSAIYHLETKTIDNGFKAYVYRLKETKIDILIHKKDFEKALSECASIQRTYSPYSSGNNYNETQIKFMQAVIFFNMGNYQPALNTLVVVKSINDNLPKIYMLEKDIYTAMNDLDAAKKSEEKLNKLYSN